MIFGFGFEHEYFLMDPQKSSSIGFPASGFSHPVTMTILLWLTKCLEENLKMSICGLPIA